MSLSKIDPEWVNRKDKEEREKEEKEKLMANEKFKFSFTAGGEDHKRGIWDKENTRLHELNNSLRELNDNFIIKFREAEKLHKDSVVEFKLQENVIKAKDMDIDTLRTDYKTIADAKAIAEANYTSLEEKAAGIVQDLETEKIKLETAKTEIKNLQEQINAKEEHISHVETVVGDRDEKIEKKQREIDTIQEKLKTVKDQLKATKDEIGGYKDERDGSVRDSIGLRDKLKIETARVEDLKRAIVDKEVKLAVYGADAHDLAIARQEIHGLRAQITKLQSDATQNGFNPRPTAYTSKPGPSRQVSNTLDAELNIDKDTGIPIMPKRASRYELQSESGDEDESSMAESEETEESEESVEDPVAPVSPVSPATPAPPNPDPIVKLVYVDRQGPTQHVFIDTLFTKHNAIECWFLVYLSFTVLLVHYLTKPFPLKKLIRKAAGLPASKPSGKIPPSGSSPFTVPSPFFFKAGSKEPIPTQDYVATNSRQPPPVPSSSLSLQEITGDASLPPTPVDNREQLPGDLPPAGGSPNRGPIQFMNTAESDPSAAAPPSTKNPFDFQALQPRRPAPPPLRDNRETVPGPLPPRNSSSASSDAALAMHSPPSPPITSPTGSKQLTWSLDTIINPNPDHLPPFWSTLFSLLLHLVFYICLFMFWSAYKERSIWLAANDSTRTYLIELLRGTRGGSWGLGGLVGEDLRRAVEIWMFKTARFMDLEMHYPLPG